MQIKIHSSYRNVVTLCDSNLIGKKFEEGIKQLDMGENFYKGEEADSEKASEILKNQAMEDATFNIVGEESINLAISIGIITKDSVNKISGIPYALKFL